MILDPIPNDFSPQFEVVGVIIECDGRILMLERNPDKPEGGTWAGPGGKIVEDEDGYRLETDYEAVVRETKEETGIVLDTSKLSRVDHGAVRYSDYDFFYTAFYIRIHVLPSVVLHSCEHTEFLWVTPIDALNMNLIEDEDYFIKKVFNL